MDDTVLFLSAYNSTQYKATNWFLRKLRNVIPHKKKQMQSLLEKHHLSFVATDETITSVDGKMEVTAQYDYVHQATTFSFKSKDSAEKENNASDSLKDSGFYINLRHAQSILVDERYFKIEFTFWLEPFLVWINGQMYQIDAGAFMMNSVLFIVFEVINYKTGKPLAKDDVGAKAENYNLLSVEKYQFFDEEKPVVPKNISLCMTHWSFRIILKIFQITFANSLIRKRLLNQLRTLVQWKYTNIIHKLVVV